MYDCFEEKDREKYLPTHILGDLDSIRSEVKDYYESKNVEIRANPKDQDTNDFQKSLVLLNELLEENKFQPGEESKEEPDENPEKVIVLNPFGGRIDQTLGSIHAMCKFCQDKPELMKRMNMILMSSSSTCQYIPKGETIIKCADSIQHQKGCGVIPLMGKVNKIKTKGLKWNMGNSADEVSALEFGGDIISTSNEITGKEVCIEVDTPVVFTTTLNNYFDEKC